MTILISFGCNAQEKRDVYNVIPLGSPLTIKILKSSEQIVPNRSELILLYNISDDVEYYDPHLLFFDDSLKLYAACYFPSERIESVTGNVITGYLNSSRNRRRDSYRNDLPKKYSLNLISRENGYGRKSDKVVEKISLDSNSRAVIMYVMKSDDPYIGVRGLRLFSDSTFIENYTLPDTLLIPLSDLSFRYQESTVSQSEGAPNDCWKWDHMLVPEISVLDDFYHDLFIKLGR